MSGQQLVGRAKPNVGTMFDYDLAVDISGPSPNITRVTREGVRQVSLGCQKSSRRSHTPERLGAALQSPPHSDRPSCKH